MGDDDPVFSVRVGRREPDAALHEGVPGWLVRPLLDWLRPELRDWSTRQIALRLHIPLARDDGPKALCEELERRAQTQAGEWDLLDAIDFLVRADFDELKIPTGWDGEQPIQGTEPLTILDHILDVGGSSYHVAIRRQRLERRIAAHTEEMFRHAADQAGGDAGRYLTQAWEKAFSVRNDPTTAYGDAVRAVEAVACPKVLPNDTVPTLGKVIAHLKQAPDKWEVRIPGKDAMGSLVAMLELLWTGHVSRHAGSPQSRDHSAIEAEAALMLAATLTHWFTTDIVQRRT
jgi:hypothetical protein